MISCRNAIKEMFWFFFKVALSETVDKNVLSEEPQRPTPGSGSVLLTEILEFWRKGTFFVAVWNHYNFCVSKELWSPN